MKPLIDLQALDLKIEKYRQRETEIPKQKNKYSIHKQRLDAELKASEERVQKLVLEQREAEKDIQAKQDLIKKYEGQLLSVKKNDEYQALLHEIEIVKKQIGVKEERILAIMMEMDDAKAALEEDKKRIAAERKGIDQEFATIDTELAEAVKEREVLEAQRAPFIAEIDKRLLSQYERIRKGIKNGPAVVAMRNDSCGGCNMALRAQLVNEVLVRDNVRTCSNCGRILYHAPNYEEAAV